MKRFKNKQFRTVEQFAEEYELNPETIRRHIREMKKEGKEFPLKIGKKYMITSEWNEAWLEWLYKKQGKK